MQAQNLKLKSPTIKIPVIRSHTLTDFKTAIKNEHKALLSVALEKFDIAYETWKKYIVRTIVGVLIVDALLLGVVAIRIYSPISPAERTAMYSFWGQSASAGSTPLVQTPPKGSETANLYSYLQTQNLNPLIVSIANRPEFSVQGRLIKVDNDSIFVFEYPNPTQARSEASAAAAKYSPKENPGFWDSNVSVYTQNDLAIFYLGNNDNIKSSLSSLAGPSLVNNQVAEVQTTTF